MAARVVAGLWAWAVCVARLTTAMPTWQSCKAECESHFTNTDLLQAALSATCGRGCDMFTLALITTPQRTRVIHLGPIAMPPRPPPPPPRSAPHDLVVEVEEQQVLSGVGQSGLNGDHKTRHTTTQPADHPVQDHPAHHQPTTTHPEEASPNHHQPTTTQVPATHPPSTSTTTSTTSTASTTSQSATPMHSDSAHHSSIIILGSDSLQQETSHGDGGAGQQVGEAVGERERLQQAKDSCRHACGTAYQVSAEREACVVGCHLQAATAAGDQRPKPRSPLAFFQHVMVSLAGHVGRLVRVTSAWTSGTSQTRYQQESRQLSHHYQPTHHQQDVRQDSHKQQENHHHQQAHHQREGHHPASGRGDEQREREATGERQQVAGPRVYYSQLLGHYTIGAGAGVLLPDPHAGHHDCRHRHVTQQGQQQQQQDTPQHSQHEKQPQDQQQHHHHIHHQQNQQHQQQQQQQTPQTQQGQQQLDLLECISRKSGLPRWFIAVTIFTSALVILWLCFTLTAPPEDIKVVKTKPPELELEEDLDDYLEDDLTCAEKKQLLAQADDVIKIKIENV